MDNSDSAMSLLSVLTQLGVIYFSGEPILAMSKQVDVSQCGELVPAVPDAAPTVPRLKN